MLWQRSIAVFTLGPLTLLLIWLGEFYFFLPVAGFLLLASGEFVSAVRKLGVHLSYFVFLPAVFAQYVAAYWPALDLFAPVTAVTSTLFLVIILWRYERAETEQAMHEWFALFGGLMLLGWVGGHLLRIRTLPGGAWQWTMYVIFTTWAVDAWAYLVGKYAAGRFFGRTPLTRRLSPNKTVQGYLGGLCIGLLFALLLSTFVLDLPLLPSVMIGLVIGLFSPLGDLGISLLKREAQIKDTSTLIPGHGGALDRLDSIIWACMFAYYIILFLGAS